MLLRCLAFYDKLFSRASESPVGLARDPVRAWSPTTARGGLPL